MGAVTVLTGGRATFVRLGLATPLERTGSMDSTAPCRASVIQTTQRCKSPSLFFVVIPLKSSIPSCHSWTGECLCKPGFSGTHCHRPCPTYTFGQDCLQVSFPDLPFQMLTLLVQVCSCKNDAYCEPEDGTCVCSPGWLGSLCDTQCEKGKYGKDCKYECGCKNGALCDPESGQCKCAAGWKGVFCDKVCPEGKYGADCSKTCDCKNGATCDHITGR